MSNHAPFTAEQVDALTRAASTPWPTAADRAALAAMTDHPEYRGFGYLGHAERTERTDTAVLVAALGLGLTHDQLFAWANSRLARHTADELCGTTAPAAEWRAAIARDLGRLGGR